MAELLRTESEETARAGGADRDIRRNRSRFARRRWRRRLLAWRPVLVVLVVLGVITAAVWAVWFSPMLSVRGVEVTGTVKLKPEQVRRAANVSTGEALMSVDLAAIRRRVADLAPVARVEVSRKWPDEVLIQVTERVPVAVVDFNGSFHGLDKDGAVFFDYTSPPPGLPEVTTPAGADTQALREAAKVAAALPPGLAKDVDHVEVRTMDQISLALTDGRTVVWGSSADSPQKVEVLQALLKLKHEPKTYDVSVPGQPVTAG